MRDTEIRGGKRTRPGRVLPGRILVWLAILLPIPGPGGLPASAQAVPRFGTAAQARQWAAQQEQAGHFGLAALAYAREAQLRRARGDPQGAQVEERRARRLATDLALAVPAPATSRQNAAKFEPAGGCYLGVLDAFGDRGETGNADDFARRLGRPIALAFDYQNYGQPFPLAWARRQAAAGRAVQIAWEPPDLTAVRDDAYLTRYAQDAARCGTPVFLRFGGEMNGDWTPWGRDPLAYRRAFRLVHEVMAHSAPNVAMVWAPNAVPTDNLDRYYPGDDAVDWVGLSLYLVRFYDDDLSRPGWQDNPAAFIEPFYRKYSARKPLCLVECGITRRSHCEGADADQWAAGRVFDLFESLQVRFPRLKMACWFDRNNLSGGRPGRRLNDFSLPAGSAALDAFRQATEDPYFLGQVATPGGSTLTYRPVGDRLPAGYAGDLLGSLSTYAVDPLLTVARGSVTLRIRRPFRFRIPPGRGSLVLRVIDTQGRVAGIRTVLAP